MYPSSILMMSVVFIVITIQTAVRLNPSSVGSFVHCWPEIGSYVISRTGFDLSRQQCSPGWSQTCSNPPWSIGDAGTGGLCHPAWCAASFAFPRLSSIAACICQPSSLLLSQAVTSIYLFIYNWSVLPAFNFHQSLSAVTMNTALKM